MKLLAFLNNKVFTEPFNNIHVQTHLSPPSLSTMDLLESKVVWLSGVKRLCSNTLIDRFQPSLPVSVFLRSVSCVIVCNYPND